MARDWIDDHDRHCDAECRRSDYYDAITAAWFLYVGYLILKAVL